VPTVLDRLLVGQQDVNLFLVFYEMCYLLLFSLETSSMKCFISRFRQKEVFQRLKDKYGEEAATEKLENAESDSSSDGQ
jgi:hypothetical protein